MPWCQSLAAGLQTLGVWSGLLLGRAALLWSKIRPESFTPYTQTVLDIWIHLDLMPTSDSQPGKHQWSTSGSLVCLQLYTGDLFHWSLCPLCHSQRSRHSLKWLSVMNTTEIKVIDVKGNTFLLEYSRNKDCVVLGEMDAYVCRPILILLFSQICEAQSLDIFKSYLKNFFFSVGFLLCAVGFLMDFN